MDQVKPASEKQMLHILVTGANRYRTLKTPI